jgi:hypothetical protein
MSTDTSKKTGHKGEIVNGGGGFADLHGEEIQLKFPIISTKILARKDPAFWFRAKLVDKQYLQKPKDSPDLGGEDMEDENAGKWPVYVVELTADTKGVENKNIIDVQAGTLAYFPATGRIEQAFDRLLDEVNASGSPMVVEFAIECNGVTSLGGGKEMQEFSKPKILGRTPRTGNYLNTVHRQKQIAAKQAMALAQGVNHHVSSVPQGQVAAPLS